MIVSFNCKETEKLFSAIKSRSLPPEIQEIALDKLQMLNAATRLQDLTLPPSNRLEKLQGKRLGQHSIRINSQWRICFKWNDGDAYDVEIIDYH
ncbi:MAG: type II toxin-antitoxin system RelE/ParE family toxin [Deferribacteraceae bacterium]|jgi:proteic killer suppression protein|nr:type II toxin-antitoxin system RelE/ParE family toxin [Deferribacteraceae bacterium]